MDEEFKNAIKRSIAASLEIDSDAILNEAISELRKHTPNEVSTYQHSPVWFEFDGDDQPSISVDVFQHGDVAFHVGDFSLHSLCKAAAKDHGDADWMRDHIASSLENVAQRIRENR